MRVQGISIVTVDKIPKLIIHTQELVIPELELTAEQLDLLRHQIDGLIWSYYKLVPRD